MSKESRDGYLVTRPFFIATASQGPRHKDRVTRTSSQGPRHKDLVTRTSSQGPRHKDLVTRTSSRGPGPGNMLRGPVVGPHRSDLVQETPSERALVIRTLPRGPCRSVVSIVSRGPRRGDLCLSRQTRQGAVSRDLAAAAPSQRPCHTTEPIHGDVVKRTLRRGPRHGDLDAGALADGSL
ncbi:hypothetical protein M885DRAFT_82319 [Pelagophyceae sp. CCMP2097]|nr:hypothetical protein M885DRAFT_82319 [Pelagophyceae sp. CCMP2097]